MKRKIRRKGLLKERIAMAVCAVTVLGVLTATGLWMKDSTSTQDRGYVVDLSEMENGAANDTGDEIRAIQHVQEQEVTGDDLDYDPYFQETGSQNVENPDGSVSESMSASPAEMRQKRKEQARKLRKQMHQQSPRPCSRLFPLEIRILLSGRS